MDYKPEKTFSEDSNLDYTSQNRLNEEKDIFPLKLKKTSKKSENKRKNLDSEDFLGNYPLNSLFFLINPEKTHWNLAKITQKHLSEKPPSINPSIQGSNLKNKEKSHNNGFLRYYDNPMNIFSLYEKGIKLNTDNWEKVCPEKLAKYIAKKAKNQQVILDGFCGIGGNAIQVIKNGKFLLINH